MVDKATACTHPSNEECPFWFPGLKQLLPLQPQVFTVLLGEKASEAEEV